jgi:hypothetical protein
MLHSYACKMPDDINRSVVRGSSWYNLRVQEEDIVLGLVGENCAVVCFTSHDLYDIAVIWCCG